MNTLQYFLSTLRPAPPPSPRASTSSLPLPPLAVEGDLGPLDVPLPPDEEKELSTEEGGAERNRLERTNSRKGKAKEDPVRDGESIHTELDRGEGIETAFLDSQQQQLPTPPPSPTPPVPSNLVPPSPSELEKAPLVPPASTSAASPAFPQLRRLIARLSTFPLIRFPLQLISTPLFGVFSLPQQFLSFFGFADPTRPEYTALLVPGSTVAKVSKLVGAHLSTEARDPTLEESSRDGTPPSSSSAPTSRITTVSLTVSLTSSTTSSTFFTTPPPPSIPRPVAPPKLTPKTLVLDLDETLIHSTSRPYRGKRAGRGLKSKVVEVVIDGRSTAYTVYKRPWVDFFLRKVSSWYTVIIFTASLPEYADPVIDWLDGGDGRGGMVGGRLFRAHCLPHNGAYVKDLNHLPHYGIETDLSRVCLVDNSPASYKVNQANGIPIEGWINDPLDECLLDLLPMLDSLRFCADVRRVLGLRGFSTPNGLGGGIVGGGGAGRGRQVGGRGLGQGQAQGGFGLGMTAMSLAAGGRR